MRNRFFFFSATALCFVSLIATAPASAKTVRECNDEYAANKPAIQGSGQRKADFIAACRVGTETIPGGPSAAPAPAPNQLPPPAAQTPAPASVKSARACDDEYAANKAAIKGSGQRKKDFIAACRAGSETIPSAPAVAPAQAAPTPVPTQAPSTRAPAPAPTAAPPVTEQRMAPPPARPTAAPTPTRPTVSGSPSGANQFATEGEAKSKCPSDTVVWVNTRSGVYHFAGTHNYGNTKNGAYMCEPDANAAGDRAPLNEKHP